MRVDLQNVKSAARVFSDNVDADHGAFGKRLMGTLAE
jgi:hypothetical protein